MNLNMCQVKPKDQTHTEWWASYDGVSTPISTSKPFNKSDDISITLFRYVSHRTTCNGAVALTFESLDGKIEVVKFFNVSLKGRNNNYPAGYLGQFNPPEQGKFRKFWMQSVGFPPSRWCRVQKSMRAALKDLIFTGTYNTAYDSKDHPYIKFSEVKLYEQSTILAHSGH